MSRFLRFLLKTAAVLAAAILVVFLVGWWLAPESVTERAGEPGPGAESRPGVVWTCSMHPQIRLPRPGACPICGMDLVAASEGGTDGGLALGEPGRRVARVETTPVRRGPAERTIRTVGRFVADERRVARLTAWIPGRIEAVHIPFPGAVVSEGAPLLDLYAPELHAVRAELRTAEEAEMPAVAEALRVRLRRSGLLEPQIEELARGEGPTARITIHAPLGGVVLEREAQVGAYVAEGDLLFRIAGLDPIGVDLEVYEQDLALVGPGTRFELSVDALPGRTFSGEVDVVQPALDAQTRTVRARAFVANPGGLARPEMFARATFRIPLGADGLPKEPRRAEFAGSADVPAIGAGSRPESRPGAPPSETAPAPRYTCPMHPEMMSDAPGRCPKCKMRLVETAPAAPEDPLLLPSSALLDLGERRIVYVERDGRYEPVPVTLGPRVGDHHVVLSGVSEGERVVSRGAFLVDSQSQIEGRRSLLFERGAAPGSAPSPAHGAHGDHE